MTSQTTTKECYTYAPETKEYTGKAVAYLSPLDWLQGREIYLLPSCATFDAPPEGEPGHVLVWTGEEWELVEDNRSKIYYDTTTQEKHEIKYLGETILETWTENQPIDRESIWANGNWEIPFEILKKRKIAEIRTIADSTLIQIKSDFSDSEVISWTKQEAGARALFEDLASKSEDAEFVRNLAIARGIPVEELVEKIKNRFTKYYETMSNVIGNQQRKEDLVAQAATPEELLNI